MLSRESDMNTEPPIVDPPVESREIGRDAEGRNVLPSDHPVILKRW